MEVPSAMFGYNCPMRNYHNTLTLLGIDWHAQGNKGVALITRVQWLNEFFGKVTCKGACSVAASYKPPMLVTRVRLPACALMLSGTMRLRHGWIDEYVMTGVFLAAIAAVQIQSHKSLKPCSRDLRGAKNRPAGNRTRAISMAMVYPTTGALML